MKKKKSKTKIKHVSLHVRAFPTTSVAELHDILEHQRAVERSVEDGTYNRGPGYDNAYSVWGL